MNTSDAGSWAPPGAPTPPPRKTHHLRTAIIAIAATLIAGIVALIAIGTATSGSTNGATVSAAPTATSPAAPAAATTQPAPTPSPDGKFDWSGDYLLANGIYDPNYLIGEVDLHNTGNVGEIVRVKFSWPQEATPPITRSKTVHLPYGASKVIRFKVPVGSYDQGAQAIDLLQSWQEHHNGEGYKATVTLLHTYGPAH
jgi:hypothetical protein